MKKDDNICYGILMNRVLIIPGIYLFRPICLLEGKIDSSTENNFFVDTFSRTFYMSEDSDSIIQDDVESITYVIKEEELMDYDTKSIEAAKAKYFEKIVSNVHIGFYISSEDIIQIIPYDLESTYINLNNGITENDTIDCNLDIDNLSEEDRKKFESFAPNYRSEDSCIIPLATLEDIVNQKSLEDMKKKLDELYFSIKLLEDDSISSNVEKGKFVSTVGNVNSGDDIIQLFVDSYQSLLSIDDIEVMKNSLEKIHDMYVNLYNDLEENKDKFDSVEAARDFLILFIDSYEKMLNMDSLEKIREEIIKLKTSEEKRILEIAVIYDERCSRKIVQSKSEVGLVESVNVDSSNLSKESKISNLLEQLNSLIGLTNVKKIVEKLIIYLDYVKRTKQIQNLENPNLNMVFKGNPGTGKTTVARILSKLLYLLGYATKDKFVEITAQDLIAGYVG